MRFLHTGDWHVGRCIRGRSRTEEFADALTEVVGIAQQEGVDAVLLAGDIYDHRTPSPESDGLVFEALVRLYEAGIPVVAIAGNHDSALRLEAMAKLLRAIDVHAVPKVAPPDRGSAVGQKFRRYSSRSNSANEMTPNTRRTPARSKWAKIVSSCERRNSDSSWANG